MQHAHSFSWHLMLMICIYHKRVHALPLLLKATDTPVCTSTTSTVCGNGHLCKVRWHYNSGVRWQKQGCVHLLKLRLLRQSMATTSSCVISARLAMSAS